MIKVVFLRHGESTWNMENRFTGWTDVGLSANGIEEAKAAGKLLKGSGYTFDFAFTSLLKRAIHTLWIVQDTMGTEWLPVEKNWQLNERHYGMLQGLNKAEVAEHYGQEQVHLWRRGFSVRPPALNPSDPRHPRFDLRYRKLLPMLLPGTESLEDTMMRALSYWEASILPAIRAGNRVLVAAHGNTLRALIKHLDGISDEDIMGLNIPTGVPLVYEFDNHFKVMTRYYLDSDNQANLMHKSAA
jgi:2,3-bisphosphoglycerate-dependent phosphoglycerate mutase